MLTVWTQKQLFDKLHLLTAPWQLLADRSEWPAVFDRLGELAIVKRRTGGYDGRGQWRLRANGTEQLPAECYGECIVEQGINFSGEVSLVGARGFDGSTVFYPLTHNLHQDGICAPASLFRSQRTAAGASRRDAVGDYAGAGLCGRDGDGVFCHPARSADQRTGSACA
ncbi:ATP-grasp domain-containing protein [Escherichia coli]